MFFSCKFYTKENTKKFNPLGHCNLKTILAKKRKKTFFFKKFQVSVKKRTPLRSWTLASRSKASTAATSGIPGTTATDPEPPLDTLRLTELLRLDPESSWAGKPPRPRSSNSITVLEEFRKKFGTDLTDDRERYEKQKQLFIGIILDSQKQSWDR
jgi:hypothetical protein